MKRPAAVSRRQWAALLLGVTLLGGLLVLRTRGLPDAVRPDAEWDALRADQLRLSATTANVLASLRRELAILERPTSAATGALAAGWQVEAESAGVSRDAVLRYHYTGSTALTWAEVGRVVTELEQRYGGRVIALDIRSRGSRQRREIAGVEIVVQRAAATPGQPADVRPPAVPASAGSAEPARPRKVGRGPSLRRPSACADRQAARLRRPARPPLRPSPTLRGTPAVRLLNPVCNKSLQPP